MFKFFRPTYRVHSVVELTPERLAAWGISSLLLDADCTLKRYTASDVTPEVREWLESLRRAKIGLCLVSNGRGKRIAQFAQNVNLPFVPMATKPLARGIRRAIREQNFNPATTAMVGDQIFADIWAGHRAKLVTIYVTPIHPEEEHWYTRIKRPLERFFLFPTASNRGASTPTRRSRWSLLHTYIVF